MSTLDFVSRLLFPTPASSYGLESFPSELVWVPKRNDLSSCKPEDFVPCLCLPSPASRHVIFYCHSNAEDLGLCYASLCHLRHQFQVHVFAFEFPGYGLCRGAQATEESVTKNAEAAFRFLREAIGWPLDSIIIMGRSIGTGPALSLASKHEVYGVILVAPFLSVRELLKGSIGSLANMFEERFPNKDRLPMHGSSILILHGKQDKLIPCWHSEQLYQLCRCRKSLVCPEEMGHNTHLHSRIEYFVLPMLRFFSLPDYCFEDFVVPRWAYNLPPGYTKVSQQLRHNCALGMESMEQRLLGQGSIPPRGFDIDMACEIIATAVEECERRIDIDEQMPEPAWEGSFIKSPKTPPETPRRSKSSKVSV